MMQQHAVDARGWDWRLLLVGAVFLLAAASKILDPVPAVQAVAHLAGHVGWASPPTLVVQVATGAVAGVEAIIGLGLCVRPTRVLILAAMAVLMGLVPVLGVFAIDPPPHGCACLGPGLRDHPALQAILGLARNALMAFLCAAALGGAASRPPRTAPALPRPSGSAAFTLVEVLLSITIISILLALSIPALRSARSSARETRSAAKVRQLLIALHQYTEDHKAFFPYFGTPGSPSTPLDPAVVPAPDAPSYFRGQAYYWLPLIQPYYSRTDALVRPVHPLTQREYISYVALTHTVAAAPRYWEEPDPDDLSLFRGCQSHELTFPSNKGLLLHIGSRIFAQTAPATALVGFGDGSAGDARWTASSMSSEFVVERDFGAISWPVLSTRRGLHGIDRRAP